MKCKERPIFAVEMGKTAQKSDGSMRSRGLRLQSAEGAGNYYSRVYYVQWEGM
jgi:hypothetical protein